jgi:hypothetical protein
MKSRYVSAGVDTIYSNGEKHVRIRSGVHTGGVGFKYINICQFTILYWCFMWIVLYYLR